MMLDAVPRYCPEVRCRDLWTLPSAGQERQAGGAEQAGVFAEVAEFDAHMADDERLVGTVIYRDHLVFVVSPEHRLAGRKSVSIAELGMETFIAHNVISPYRDKVPKEFQRRRVPLNMDVEMPTVESIRRLVQRNEGVAFLPRMCVEQEVGQGLLCEVEVEELSVDRSIRLVYPARRALSHAARAFLEMVKSNPLGG
jgi:DNA-binding transcriptional LysR family regulator